MTICNCCPCCCIARAFTYGNKELKGFIKKMPGVEVKISDDCTGCGLCVESGACIFRAIKMEDGQVRRTEACVACGRCADICPEHAIEIIMDKKSIDDAIETLTIAVDVK
jgi:ferredoxin